MTRRRLVAKYVLLRAKGCIECHSRWAAVPVDRRAGRGHKPRARGNTQAPNRLHGRGMTVRLHPAPRPVHARKAGFAHVFRFLHPASGTVIGGAVSTHSARSLLCNGERNLALTDDGIRERPDLPVKRVVTGWRCLP